MELKEVLGLIMAIVATIGGLTIGGIAVYISVVRDMKARLASIEARNKERLALIEKGMDPSLLDQKTSKDIYGPLLWGLLLCGIALGALIGYGISYYSGIKEIIMVNAMAMLLGGAGLLIYYAIRKKQDAKKVL